MKLTQKIYDDLSNFHKKMQKLTGLKGKRGEKLLKKLKGKMRGGGSDSEEDEPMDEVRDYVGEQLASVSTQENGREGQLRQYLREGTVVLNDVGAALAFWSPDPDVRRRAADAVLRPAENREMARQIVRELLAGTVFVTTAATYWFFDGIRDVVRGMRIPYPQPPQVGDDNSYACQYFGRGCQQDSTSSWFSTLYNFGANGGYYFMMAFAWLTDMLNRLASAGVIGFTACVFMLVLFFALHIDGVHERGGRIWLLGGLFGSDTRVQPQRQQQNMPRALQRLEDDQGNLAATRYSDRVSRSRRRRGKTPVSVKRRNTWKKRKKRKKKEKKRLTKKAMGINIPDEPTFKFPDNDKDPDNDGAGLTTGGKRRKRRKRTRRRSNSLIHKLFRLAGGKRRKRKRKTKRKR